MRQEGHNASGQDHGEHGDRRIYKNGKDNAHRFNDQVSRNDGNSVEKKSDLSAQSEAQFAAPGFFSSSTNIVMMVASIASVNALSLSLLILQQPLSSLHRQA